MIWTSDNRLINHFKNSNDGNDKLQCNSIELGILHWAKNHPKMQARKPSKKAHDNVYYHTIHLV